MLCRGDGSFNPALAGPPPDRKKPGRARAHALARRAQLLLAELNALELGRQYGVNVVFDRRFCCSRVDVLVGLLPWRARFVEIGVYDGRTAHALLRRRPDVQALDGQGRSSKHRHFCSSV